MKSLRLKIKKHAAVVELLDLARHSPVEVEALIKEMRGLHASRAVRALSRDMVMKRARNVLIDALLDNQKVRSRLVEIRVDSNRYSEVLDQKRSLTKKLMLAEFDTELRAVAKTQADRNNFVDYCFRSVVKRIAECQQVSEYADAIIIDVDAAGWTIQRTINVLNLQTAAERSAASFG